MKKVFILVVFFLKGQLFAQELVNIQKDRFVPPTSVSYDDFFDIYGSALNLAAENNMVAQTTYAKNKNIKTKHVKYLQYYKGIEVYGVAYTLHGDGQNVKYGTGTYLPNLNITVEHPLTSTQAESKAVQYIMARSAKPFTKIDKHKKWMSDVKGLVIIDRNFPDISGEYTLAFKIHVSVKDEAVKHEVIISTNDNMVIFDQSIIKHGQSDGIGKTFYYGNQQITTDSIAPDKFVLRDLSRGEGITTYTMSSGIPRLLEDKDNIWDDENANDLVAIDAHWTTSKFYDMMFDSLDYSGLDGNGKSMNPVIFYGGIKNFINAFWDGDKAYFGHGDCHNGPLTTLTVVAHEFTHGITQYTSNLIYNGESGALNESMSDIFGKALDIQVNKDNFSWDLGPDFSLSPFSNLFRSFSDPNKVGHPKKYKGYLWEDDAGVHTNSSVMNHWFYLLVEGGVGENEGIAYDIPKMDMTELLKVIFLCQTSYLTPTSGYQEMYEYSLLACSELFGNPSTQYSAIKEAWKAVGLPYISQSGPIVDLALEIPEPFGFSCDANPYQTVLLKVINKGNTNINKNEKITFRIFMNEIETQFSKNLLPDESEEFVLDDFLEFGEFGLVFEDIELVYELDENPINNTQIVFYQQFESEESDLLFSGASLSKKSCFSDIYKWSITLQNASCQVILPDQTFLVKLSHNGTILMSIPLKTSDYIFPGNEQSFNGEVSFAGEYKDIEVSFEASFDAVEGNNIYFLNVENLPIVNSPFAYTFDELSDFGDEFSVSYSVDYGFYAGENYLFTTGSGEASAPCPVLKDNFEFVPFSDNTSYIQACLDLSNLNETELSFDMLQFRSGTYDYLNDPAFSNQTSVLKLEWISQDNTVENFIYGLPKGEQRNQKFKLPKGFKGLFRMGFYNNFGFGYFETWLSDRVDAILVDNLKLEELTSTKETEYETASLKIMPNPSTDIITLLNHEGLNAEYNISSPNGIKMENGFLNGNQLNISQLPAGYYLLQTRYNGLTRIGAFVKI